VVEESACTNGWNSDFTLSGSMPMPEIAHLETNEVRPSRTPVVPTRHIDLPRMRELHGVAEQVEQALANAMRVRPLQAAAPRHSRPP